jgi:hypothetical protein
VQVDSNVVATELQKSIEKVKIESKACILI